VNDSKANATRPKATAESGGPFTVPNRKREHNQAVRMKLTFIKGGAQDHYAQRVFDTADVREAISQQTTAPFLTAVLRDSSDLSGRLFH